MATFTTRNVKHVYVANGAAAQATTPGYFTGALSVDNGSAFHLLFTNAEGKVVKTDKIAFDKIRSIKVSPYTPRVLRVDKLTVSAPVVGQEYMIRIIFRNWGSGSAENQYVKHVGAYKAVTGNTAETIVDNLVALGTLNFSREAGSYLTFAKEAVTKKLVITEVAQPWALGKVQGRPLDYTIQLAPIVDNGVEVYNWATIATTGGTPGNGTYQQAADLEYFFMAERGDKYGLVGYPYNIDVRYLVEQGANYHMLDIAYFETQEGEGVQASEKQILILAKVNTATIVAITTAINALKANTVTPIADPVP